MRREVAIRHCGPHLADSVAFLLEEGVRYLIVSLNYAGPWREADLDELRRQYERLAGLYIRWTREGRKFYLSPFEVKLYGRFADFKAVGPASLRGEVEAGLVIHEGQLTAAAEGLRIVEDLGKRWKARTGLPLPLGLNAVKRALPEPVRRAAAIAWKASIDYGLAHRREALDYAMTFARGLPRDKADAFVGMYVNGWTRELGPRGREAVARFLGEAADAGLVPRVAIEYQER